MCVTNFLERVGGIFEENEWPCVHGGRATGGGGGGDPPTITTFHISGVSKMEF